MPRQLSENEGYRQELREAVQSFQCGQHASQAGGRGGEPPHKHLNVYLFGPQGSGKTSFIRSCFHALYGPKHSDNGLVELEHTLHRSDDGTLTYTVYSLTERICLHDTRGQREYTKEEMQQLKLVLEGRARNGVVIQQRRRYWLLLREFWRSDEQMRNTFSRTVMLPRATLDTEPHFVFLVLDPNQQELLLEDRDFQECYSGLLGNFSDRGLPHALLCTHGDTLSASLREALLSQLPEKLSCRPPKVLGPAALQRPDGGGAPTFTPPPNFQQGGPGPWGGQQAPRTGSGDAGAWRAPAPPPAAPSPFAGAPAGRPALQPAQRMPDVMRIVSNYTDTSRQRPCEERDHEGNDVQQDIHTLLVLLDALRQADSQVGLRMAGTRSAPMPSEAESGCPIL